MAHADPKVRSSRSGREHVAPGSAGWAVASRAVAVGAAVAGLFTNGASAEFDDAVVRRVNTPQNLVLDPSFETAQSDATSPWRVTGAAATRGGEARYWASGWTSSGGTLTQRLTGLEPGAEYTLTAWVRAARKTLATITVDGAAAPASARSKKKKWVELTVTFRAGSSSADLLFRADRGTASIDEVYVRKS